MKILFINSHSADYVQDLTYSGLVKILGAANVIDYHWNKKYHVPYKKYPKNLGYTPGTLLSFFKKPDITKVDALLIGASKVDTFETYLEIIDSIPKNIPIIFIDGGDRETIGGDLTVYERPELYQKAIDKRPFDLIFKREYLLDGTYDKNVFPLPISFNLDRLPRLSSTPYKYDVGFWAVESHQVRIKALNILENLFDCKENGTTRKQVFSKYKRKGTFYLEELMASKITLNIRGGGWDTVRYWEVPAVGAFMLSQKPGILIPNNFEDKKHVVYFKDDLSDMVELCEFYLENKEEREQIAKAGFEHLKRYHTDVARAEFILEKINEIL